MLENDFLKSQLNPNDLYNQFFNVDLLNPDFYFIFKKDIFDLFVENPNIRFENSILWKINVFATWKYLNRIEPDDVLNYVPEQVLTAARLGYNVFDYFIYYLNSNKIITPEILKEFYGEFRRMFFDLDEKINDNLSLKDLIKEMNFLTQKDKNSPEFLALKNKIKESLNKDLEKDPVYNYFPFYQDDGTDGLLDLIQLFATTGPEQILEKLEEVLFIKANGVKPQDLDLKLNSEIKKEVIEKKPVSTPTYSQIKSKILQFFPKDEAGDIVDIEGVFEVLEKTADKYGDPKIKELYYYNEATGKFEWGL